MELLDLQGKTLKRVERPKQTGESCLIRAAELSPGTYILKVRTSKGQLTKKLVKE